MSNVFKYSKLGKDSKGREYALARKDQDYYVFTKKEYYELGQYKKHWVLVTEGAKDYTCKRTLEEATALFNKRISK